MTPIGKCSSHIHGASGTHASHGQFVGRRRAPSTSQRADGMSGKGMTFLGVWVGGTTGSCQQRDCTPNGSPAPQHRVLAPFRAWATLK